MNLNSLKDPNGQASNGGAAAAASIPSLKRTLSGGSTGVHGHASSGVSGMGGMSSMPSVMHANTNTNPPQMLRAVTSSGVFNRPGSSTNASRNITGSSTSLTSNSLGSGMGSAGGARNNSGSSMSDWRMYLTIEERQAVRSKIRDAYASRCNSFEDLLQVACAIEEELLHISAPSRLDYFKSGFEFENRVKLKKDQLQGQLAALDAKRRPSSSPQPHGGNGGSGNSGPNSSPNGPSDGSYSAKKQRT
ncbi:TPA: hypothetical protein N0F65_005173 [Lagenidium giganteum]|uniref:Uncharacterized protein n=1 Tax=Lagenidium giganteum TaxID=4803 RepID=A0AAV2YW77_9STRA|nr:TPA: hypothetical protein N0F65_005173 [Lagenidium giganteum]